MSGEFFRFICYTRITSTNSVYISIETLFRWSWRAKAIFRTNKWQMWMAMENLLELRDERLSNYHNNDGCSVSIALSKRTWTFWCGHFISSIQNYVSIFKSRCIWISIVLKNKLIVDCHGIKELCLDTWAKYVLTLYWPKSIGLSLDCYCCCLSRYAWTIAHSIRSL